jgi:DNA-3-methyladenine glycosylase II
LAAAHGEVDPFVWRWGGRTGETHFASMALHIVAQQISTTVAFVVFDRVVVLLGAFPDAEGLLSVDPDRLRACGLSASKTTYLLDLAQRQATGVIDIEHMDHLSDGEVVEQLTAVRGIGLWSAEMFMIHQLHRSDVLPAGDLGIRKGVMRTWSLSDLPTVAAVRERSLLWAPYRTYAATLLWREALASEGGRRAG